MDSRGRRADAAGGPALAVHLAARALGAATGLGSFGRFPLATVLATTVVVFSAAYLLWAVQRVFFDPLSNPANEGMTDLNRRELAVIVPMVAAMIWMGLYPQPLLRRTEAAARRYVEMVRPHVPPPALGLEVRE